LNSLGAARTVPIPPEACITLSKPLVLEDRTVMVDTNYLTALNAKDIMAMLFDKDYEKSISNPFKQQMCKIFRDAFGGSISLCLSNLILGEFIGAGPRKVELAELYRRYISVVEPKDNLETCFFNLAAAIDAALVETTGEAGDIKDTYSYMLASLAHIRYFVTEDSDIRRLYSYLAAVRIDGYKAIEGHIRTVRKAFGTLCKSKFSEDVFPIGNILERLYWGPIPTPISVVELKNALADVLTKTETILVMQESLSRIDSILATLRDSETERPKEFDETPCSAARNRVESVAKCIGLPPENGNIEMFRVGLVEKESSWAEDQDDKKLSDALAVQLEILEHFLLADEDEGYDTLEERYNAEEFTKVYLVKCDDCEKESDVEAYYQGVTLVEPREMGPQSTHEWEGDVDCPNCKNELHVEYTRWEYPMNWFNDDELETDGCSLVPEKRRDRSQTTLD